MSGINGIDPKAIEQQVSAGGKASVAPKAAFGDVMLAMGPATSELVNQWSGGSEKAGAVLNAAFSGVDVGNQMSYMSGSSGGYGAYASSPGLMGSPKYTTQPGFAAANTGGMMANPDDPAAYQKEIMQTMNTNNLKLLELQANMQSNMQSWTTKSNILSADHRARMSLIEKFTARG